MCRACTRASLPSCPRVCLSQSASSGALSFLMFKADAWLNVSFPYKPICFKCKAKMEAKTTARRERKGEGKKRKRKEEDASRRSELVRAETSLKSF